MRRITAIVCSILFVAFFQSSFGGSSAGHQIRIVVQHHPNQNETATDVQDQIRFDSYDEPVRMETERYTASLGYEGDSHHLRWAQKKVVPNRYCVTMNHLNEIEDALPILFKYPDRIEFKLSSQVASTGEKLPLIYWTVTDAI